MPREDPNPLAIERSLKHQLKGRSRRRREDLECLATPGAAPRVLRNDVLPLLEIAYVPLDELRSPARKVRARDAAHVREVAASISALGFCSPILIGKNNMVLDGEIRLEAAKLLALGRAPCVRIEHLSAVEQRLLRLTVNRLGEKGQWDLEELKLEFEQLILDDAPIEISGFSPDEIDQILTGDELDVVEQGPLAPAPGALAVARLGDVFQLGPHRLICGDATDPIVLRRLMEGDPPAWLVLTDEPYNVKIAGHVTGGAHREFAMASGEMNDAEFLGFNVAWAEAALPHLCDGGVFGTFIDWRGAPIVAAAAARLRLTPLNLIVWAKTNAGMGSLYRSQHELLPLFKKGEAPHINNVELGKRGRWRSNVWTYPGASSLGSDARRGLQDHPTVKPTAMLQDALLDLSDRGDIVLDPFLGSGSTLIAANKTGRVCRGVELDPLYVDVIVRRYEAATGKSAMLLETGETFAALAARRAGEEPRHTDGEAVGVNDATSSPQGDSVGLGFAIPGATADTVVKALEYDDVLSPGVPGVQIEPVSDDIGVGSGLEVVDGAPDDQTGLGAPTAEAEIPYSRDDAESTATVTLESQKAESTAMANGVPSGGPPVLGVKMLAAEHGSGSDDQGVVIVDVDPNGAAASKGFSPGDVILEVSGNKVSEPLQVMAEIAIAKRDRKNAVLMRIKTSNGARFVAFALPKA